MIGPNDIHTAARLFQPARMTVARELKGITKTELAKRIGKTAAAVGQFESAVTKPDGGTVAKLALALGVPASFFAEPLVAPIVPFEACHFRSQRAASQRERRKVLAAGALVRELVTFLEKHISFPAERVSAVAATPADDDDIERIAAEVRKAWGLGMGPIPNVIQLLESRGIVVTFVREDSDTIDAFSFWHEARPCMFLVMAKGSTSRARFDAAHELGHLVMHVEVSHADQAHERQANRFASSFLMPKDTFARECPRRFDWDHLLELKRRWRTSVAAIIHRAFSLELFSEASYRRGFMFLNQRGYRKDEPCEPAAENPQIIARSVSLLKDAFNNDPEALAELDMLTRLVGHFVIPFETSVAQPKTDGAWALPTIIGSEIAGRAAVAAALLAHGTPAPVADVRLLAVLALDQKLTADVLPADEAAEWRRLTDGPALDDKVIDAAISSAATTLYDNGYLLEGEGTWAPSAELTSTLVQPSILLERAAFAKTHALASLNDARRTEVRAIFPRALSGELLARRA